MNSVKCPACKLTNFASAAVCRRCGAAINALGQLSSDAGLPDPQPDVAADTVLFEIGVKSNQGPKIGPSKNQLMGKLVLTSSRLCFLAGGTSDSTASKILLRALLGAAGSVAAELLEGLRIQQRAKTLDWSALRRAGSWAYDLAEIEVCEVTGSIWTLPSLRILGRTWNQSQESNVIYRQGLSKRRLLEINLQIQLAVVERQKSLRN